MAIELGAKNSQNQNLGQSLGFMHGDFVHHQLSSIVTESCL